MTILTSIFKPSIAVDFIFVQHELGASTTGSKSGPTSVFNALQQQNPTFKSSRIDTINQPSVSKEKQTFSMKNIHLTLQTMKRLRDSVQESLSQKHFVIVLSGDHSTAVGTAAGIKKAFPRQKVGMIWFDAHTDIHSPFTSHSSNLHGMPVGAITSQDNLEQRRNQIPDVEKDLWNHTKNLAGVTPMIELKDVAFVGIRDLEDEEKALVHAKACLLVDVPTIEKQTVQSTVAQIQSYLSHCDVIYISFDIDCLDITLVPGTGTPVSQGPNVEKIIQMVHELSRWEKVICFEMSEVNPALDHEHKTIDLAAHITSQVLPHVE